MLFRYPGGKKKLTSQISNRIIRYYNDNDCWNTLEYVEPFAGSLSIGLTLLNYKIIKNICINDKDPGISALWTSVISYPKYLCEFISSFSPSIDAFYNYKKYFENIENISKEEKKALFVEIAFRKLALHQMSYSGLGVKAGGPIGGRTQSSNYKIDCRWNAKLLKRNIHKYFNILSQTNIRYNKCSSYGWSKIIKDCKNSFIYLDPPYYNKGSELYQFSFSEYNHRKLSETLKKIKFPWLLSYDHSEEIKKLYSWAKSVEIDNTCTINGPNKKIELLITSPEYGCLLDSLKEEDMFNKETEKCLD